MNIVILNGSPRMGNTRTLLKRVEEGIETNVEQSRIDFIDLNDQFIKPCDACNVCVKLEGKCIHKDDTNDIMTLVTKADVIVFGTPVYWWGISSQLKLMIDKFYTWHGTKYQVHGKKIAIISVGGDSLDSPQYQLISDQFKCISDFLKWQVIFDEKFSASAIGDIEKDSNALELCSNLYKKL